MSYNDQIRELDNRKGSIAENPLIHWDITSYSQHQTKTPGASATTFHVVLDYRLEAFHKPLKHTIRPLATSYGHNKKEPMIHDCAAWRLAHELGGILEEIVAPTVLRDHPDTGWGSLSRRWYGIAKTMEPMHNRPDQALAAAFFDSLIAQQDRHLGNMRWNDKDQHLGLYDHGFAFAVPGDYCNHSDFVKWRWGTKQQGLQSWEREALTQLLNSHDLLGMRAFLKKERAQRLEHRAQEMLSQDSILALKAF